MKILMVNHPYCDQYDGGDGKQLQSLASELRTLGHTVDVSNAAEPDGKGYDIAHVFNIRTVATTEKQIAALTIPIVLTPFWADMRLVAVGMHRVKTGMSLLDCQVQAALVPGWKDFCLRIDASLSSVKRMMPSSWVELHGMRQYTRAIPADIVPTCTDYQAPSHPSAERKYVLCVSRIEPPKGQLMLAEALRGWDIPLILVGKIMDESYAAQCREHGATVLGWKSEEEVAELRLGARVHALCSWVETCGIASLEAAVRDCSLVVSCTGCETEYFQNEAYFCNPFDVASVRTAIITAWRSYDKDIAKRDMLRFRILREYNWLRSAKLTVECYQKALGV